MGLSVAIGLGIISISFMFVFSIFPVIVDSKTDVADSKKDMFEIKNNIKKTNFTINQINGTSGSNFANFTLTNTGLEKLSDYEKFNLYITYDADISGTKTKTTESFTYDAASSFLLPTLSFESDGSIKYDAYASDTGDTDLLEFSHVVTTVGTEKILILAIATEDRLISSATYGDQALTNIRNDTFAGDKINSAMWYLVNPPTGNNTVSIVLSEPSKILAGAISFTGNHPSNPITNHNGTTDTSTIASVNIDTTTSSALIIDSVAFLTQHGLTADAEQIEKYNQLWSSYTGGVSTKELRASGTHTMSWNATESKEWAMSVAVMEPGSGGGSKIACTTGTDFETNEWIIDSIGNDYMDPHIINSDETARICAKLEYPIYANGEIKVTLITNLGNYANKTSTVT